MFTLKINHLLPKKIFYSLQFFISIFTFFHFFSLFSLFSTFLVSLWSDKLNFSGFLKTTPFKFFQPINHFYYFSNAFMINYLSENQSPFKICTPFQFFIVLRFFIPIYSFFYFFALTLVK